MNNLSKILSYTTLGTLCAFLLQIVSAKILSVYDYGVIAKWLTDLAFLSIFFVFGLDNSLLFFSKKNNNDYNKKFFINLVFFSFSGFLLLFISFLINSIYYILLVLSCYILAIIQSFNAYNQLNENFNKYGIINFLKSFFLFVFFLILFLIDFKINSNQYLFLYSLILIFTLFLVFFISYKPVFKSFSYIDFLNKEYFVYGSKSMLNTFLAILLYSLTIYFLDYYESKKEVGLFFAATVLSKLAWVIPDSVGNLLYPKFLKINIKYTKEQVMKETFFYAQFNFILNILAIFLFALLGKLLINLIYGDEYKEIFYLVIVLLIGNQGMVYYKILGRYLASINEWKVQRISLIVAVIFNIISNMILIKYFGLLGAAISTALSFWICGLIMSYNVRGSFIGFINLKIFIRELLYDK